MARLEQVSTPRGTLRVAFTDRADGDFRVDGPLDELEARRRGLVDHRWTWLRQVHGHRVVVVSQPGEGAGTEADGAVTNALNCPLAVTTADCAPVVLVAEEGFAVVHAGWRGLMAGVIDNAAQALAAIGGPAVATLIGPCINPAAYEFGADDLELAAAALGPAVRAATAWGTPALDVPVAVEVVCRRLGWPPPSARPPCTSQGRYFSYRTRGDHGRQTAVAWFEAGTDPGALRREQG